MAQLKAFNFWYVQARLEALSRDERKSHLVIMGWPNLELLLASCGRGEEGDQLKFTL
jgi:hypothetical protein